MKIAFFNSIALNYGGGAEKYFITTANEMARNGHSVSIINLNKSFYRKLTIALSIYYVSNSTAVKYTDAEIKSMLKGVEWLRPSFGELKRTLSNFDVIYSKDEILDLGILKLIGHKSLPPIIVGVHTPIYYSISDSFRSKIHNFLYLSPLYKWLLKDCAFIHVPNSDDELFIRKHFPDFKNRIFKIFYPFDSNIFKPSKPKIKDNKFRILFAGRLVEQKGIDVLIKIIEKLSNEDLFKDLHFSIAGSGPLDKEIKRLNKKFRNFDYLGHVPPKNMPQVYSDNDIFIAPSRYEMLPWAILEAQSCGLPVIVTDIPGPRDIVINGKTGFLAKYTVEDFIEKILYFFDLKRNNPEKFNGFGNKARENIQEKFEPSKIYDQLDNMFKEANGTA